MSEKHIWKFFRAGGVDQVSLETGADLLHLDDLDQKLWVALSCPTKGLECDVKTLELIDADKDGRVRAPEIIAAVKWAAAHLKDANLLIKGGDTLPLSAINDATDDGKRLLSSAQRILVNLGKPPATISVADTVDTVRIFSATKFNGDGIIPVDSAEDAPTQQVIKEIIASCGAEVDRVGTPGVSQAKADLFFAEAQAYLDWRRKGEAEGVMILGAGTLDAVAALDRVRAKIEDYFTRCRMAAFDARAIVAMNRLEADYVAFSAKELSNTTPELSSFPIAHIEPQRALPLSKGLNPAWAEAMQKFREQAVEPLLGAKEELSEAEWISLNARFAGVRGWQSSKAGSQVEKLGLPRVEEILASGARDAVNKLLTADRALEPEMNSIAAVDRLVRFHRDLFIILKNFVSFSEFYSRDQRAIFQAGRLYLDGRSCDLCVKVSDVAKHAILATLSRVYLMYCECTRKGSTEKMIIAAGFTGGDSDNLMVGRNGIFYDRAGLDWDATIVRIVEHPISIRQAILAPYKRFAKMVGEQIEKIAASRDKAMTDKAAAGIASSAKVVDGQPTPAAPPKPGTPPEAPFDAAKFAGVFAAIGFAIGTLGTALASIGSGFLKLLPWQMPLAILGVFIAVSGPSAVLAFLKLRQRNLGPILDACGWAVNGRMKINLPFGAALTRIAALPPGAKRRLDDPYPETHKFRTTVLVIALLATIAASIYAVRNLRIVSAKTPAPLVTPK